MTFPRAYVISLKLSSPPEGKGMQPMERKKVRLYILWSLLAVGLVYALWGFSHLYFQDKAESGLLYASGRIEGTEVTVGTKVAGRVEKLSAEEGDRVEREWRIRPRTSITRCFPSNSSSLLSRSFSLIRSEAAGIMWTTPA